MQLGRSLAFTMDGHGAAIGAPDGVHLVTVTGARPPTFHPAPAIRDIVAVGTEIWVATTASRLLRFRADGKLRDELPLWGGLGLLHPCVVGARGALWSESPPAVIPDAGAITAIALSNEPDLVIPVSSTRWVVCHRDRVHLRDPGTERWVIAMGTGGRVVDGAVLFDGRTVALVLASGDHFTQLVVINLHDGVVQHRLTLSGIDLVRFAAVRGFAMLRSQSHSIVMFDLRFGRVLKEHREERAIVDVAIDNAGQTFMLRFGDSHEDIAIGGVRALLAGPSVPQLVVVDTPEPIEEPVAELPVVPQIAFHRGEHQLGVARSLAPRREQTLVGTAQAVALLERYRSLLASMVGSAIARAWDEGRLSLPAAEGTLPFKAEVSGLLGRLNARAPKEVLESDAEVAKALGETRRAESTLEALAPLASLAIEFGLSPVAQLVLLVIAAPSLWGELARLYGILSNDEARPLVDELCVSQILVRHASHYDIARELDRDAPLVRHGLVYVGGSRQRPFLALSCDMIVLRLLRGADCEADLEDVRIVSQFRDFDSLLIPGSVKDDIAMRLAEAPASAKGRVVVRGRSGSGRHAILATLAAAAGRWLGIIDATAMMRDIRRRLDELRVALRRAHLLGLLPCVDGLENLPADDPSARDLVRQLFDEHPGPLAVRLPWDSEPPLNPGYLGIDLPQLSMEQRIATWNMLLEEHGLKVRDPSELADRYRIGPGVIATVCQVVVAQRASELADAVPSDADASLVLETAIRQHLDTQLRATATRVQHLATWARVVLPPDIQESVLELIARIKHRRTVYDTWGMGEVLSTARGVTALFQGGPGTGKTLVASAIANELGMDLYRVDLSRIMSKWIGETEQNLAKLFDAAEDGHAIILFDEADSLFAKRTEVKSSVDRYANLEVNYLLQRLDTFEGIAILTTNFGTAIDNAFKRRLSFRLTFPFPDEEAREALWKTHLPTKLPRTGDFDLGDLARKYRLSGGYIRNATLRAAFLAAEEHVPLSQDHLERAIKAEFREIGKIAESGVLE